MDASPPTTAPTFQELIQRLNAYWADQAMRYPPENGSDRQDPLIPPNGPDGLIWDQSEINSDKVGFRPSWVRGELFKVHRAVYAESLLERGQHVEVIERIRALQERHPVSSTALWAPNLARRPARSFSTVRGLRPSALAASLAVWPRDMPARISRSRGVRRDASAPAASGPVTPAQTAAATPDPKATAASAPKAAASKPEKTDTAKPAATSAATIARNPSGVPR